MKCFFICEFDLLGGNDSELYLEAAFLHLIRAFRKLEVLIEMLLPKKMMGPRRFFELFQQCHYEWWLNEARFLVRLPTAFRRLFHFSICHHDSSIQWQILESTEIWNEYYASISNAEKPEAPIKLPCWYDFLPIFDDSSTSLFAITTRRFCSINSWININMVWYTRFSSSFQISFIPSFDSKRKQFVKLFEKRKRFDQTSKRGNASIECFFWILVQVRSEKHSLFISLFAQEKM